MKRKMETNILTCTPKQRERQIKEKSGERKDKGRNKLFIQKTFINTMYIDLRVWNTEITMA